MALQARVQTRGGHKVRRIIRDAKNRKNKQVRVGFFSTSRYQDGTPVAAVGAWNEFGTQTSTGGQHTPERPYFRQSIVEMKKDLPGVAKKVIDPKTMEVDDHAANSIGAYAQGVIQTRIRDLRSPPNAPYTIAKKGSSNPLIDKGKMRQSVTWVVE